MAAGWFCMAATGGHTDAPCALGLVLLSNKNDKLTALRWFYCASQSNHPYGHYYLAQLFLHDNLQYRDIGVHKDGQQILLIVTCNGII